MSRIKGRDTKPELALRRALWAVGLRYRLRVKLPGKPDMVFPSARLAVFVDGCFWHGCPVHAVRPETNVAFWESKISGNVARDREVTDELTAAGWNVFRFWEHEIANDLGRIVEAIQSVVDKPRGSR